MIKIDTSTEAVTKLMDGVTPGPWRIKDCESAGYRCANYHQEIWNEDTDILVTTEVTRAHNDGGAKNMRFIRAARDLVPALLAERDALKKERDEAMEGWHVIHPNITVQADDDKLNSLTQSRDHFKSRADVNKARVSRLRHRQRSLVSALELVMNAGSWAEAKQIAAIALGGWEDEALIYSARTAGPKPVTVQDAARVLLDVDGCPNERLCEIADEIHGAGASMNRAIGAALRAIAEGRA